MKRSTVNPPLAITPGSHSVLPRNVLQTPRFVLLLGAIIAMLACSCKKEDNHLKGTVPFHAEFTTMSTMLQEGPPELDSIYGEGHGTLINKSSFIAHAQFDEDFNLTGTITATAQNGDEFYASITGHAPNIDETTGDITLHFQAIITGGTGLFEGATGSFSGIAHESIYKPEGKVTWDGTITLK